MKRKRDLVSKAITKYKARLNLHGGKQEYAVNFYETYAPVVMWHSIRLLLIIVIINLWSLVQVDFVMAYPQADIEFDMYMELPAGVEMKQGSSKSHVLRLLKDIYGQKQAGRVLNEHLKEQLLKLGY